MSYKRRKNVGLTPRFARNLVQRERTGVLSDVYCNVGEVAVSDDSKTGLYRTPRAEQADRGDEGQDATAVNQEPNGGGTQANRDANQDQKIRDIESESQRRERATYRLAIAGVLIAAASVAVSTLQWSVMRDQLADARASGADAGIATLRAYRLTKQQADAMTDVAAASKQTANAAYYAQLQVSASTEPPLRLTASASGTPQGGAVGQVIKPFVELITMGGSAPHNIEATLAAELLPRGMAASFGKENVVISNGSMTALGQLRSPYYAPIVDRRTEKLLRVISPDVVAGITTGQLRLMLHGKVTYEDWVGCHWVTFCSVFDPTVNAGAGTLMNCPNHQGEQGECEKTAQRVKR